MDLHEKIVWQLYKNLIIKNLKEGSIIWDRKMENWDWKKNTTKGSESNGLWSFLAIKWYKVGKMRVLKKSTE